MTSQTKKKNMNRYKFTFGSKDLTLTTEKSNLFMEEVEQVAREKYEDIKKRVPDADNETVAILLAINSLSMQLSREIDVEKMEAELHQLRASKLEGLKEKVEQAVEEDEA
ncbi:hypothetical protein [Streptococcus saliviloxodontae]|uniref:Demethoxyubiquinone hydroxylase (CLK1/Coq7/Cat5 family) n=1 Tax=Streptococcus saliviloxodontae TaxID=1349416 RepID=A0ABS2PJ42_9STRE|nr:hypothetical protein [Streptococcus saliviloxodontae]MBM7635297.1 demethoxyubiquinone hydroxylase (CLK1/Coq7/Cat5 family) [Streptococcus saliviloxodontae]